MRTKNRKNLLIIFFLIFFVFNFDLSAEEFNITANEILIDKENEILVGEGSVISMGVFIGASTKIVDRTTGEIHMGKVPPYSVVVSGSLPGKPLPDGSIGPSLYCAVIVKRVDEKTRSKTSVNDLLRD